MTDEQTPEPVIEETPPIVTTALPPAELQVRDEEQRIIGAKIVSWDDPVDTPIGLESFARGAFAHVDPSQVALRLGHDGPPVGKGISLEERADGAYMDFRVSKTQRGDEALELARDGVTRYVSVEYYPAGSKADIQTRGNRQVRRVVKADLRGVATTYAPYYRNTAVMYVRDQQ